MAEETPEHGSPRTLGSRPNATGRYKEYDSDGFTLTEFLSEPSDGEDHPLLPGEAGTAETKHSHGPNCGHVAYKHRNHFGYLVADGVLDCKFRTLDGRVRRRKHTVTMRETKVAGATELSSHHLPEATQDEPQESPGAATATSVEEPPLPGATSVPMGDRNGEEDAEPLEPLSLQKHQAILEVAPLSRDSASIDRALHHIHDESAGAAPSCAPRSKRIARALLCKVSSWKFLFMFVFVFGYFFAELIVGILSTSLALQVS